MSDRTLAVSLHQAAPIPLAVDFSCGPGQVLAIFGPSGSGKTTILRTIAGLRGVSTGTVRCGGEVWTDAASGTFVPAHRRRVGFVFQDYALFPHLSARGNVGAALSHVPASRRRDRTDELLQLVGLTGKAERRPQDLSGGERQRVALARALARDPDVLLLDEPFAAVDRQVRRRLQVEIDELRIRFDVPIVLVTHDFDDVVRLATDVLLLDGGKVLASGSLTAVTSRPDLPWLRDAVGLGVVFEATVTGRVRTRLTELAFDGGTLLVPGEYLPPGTVVRVRIPAREVILATRAPEGLSLHNALAGTVATVVDGPDQAIVQIAIGRTNVLAEITHDAVARLDVKRGMPIHALVKSVSIDLLRVRTQQTSRIMRQQDS